VGADTRGNGRKKKESKEGDGEKSKEGQEICTAVDPESNLPSQSKKEQNGRAQGGNESAEGGGGPLGQSAQYLGLEGQLGWEVCF